MYKQSRQNSLSSLGTCYSGTNNTYTSAPPLMSDKRMFTYYDPNNTLNERVMTENNIQTNYEYRQYLTKHGDTIVRQNQEDACNECGGCPYSETNKQMNSEGKYLFKGSSDLTIPYGYEASDMKSYYLDKQSLDSRMHTSVLTQGQLMQLRTTRAQ